MHPFYINNDQSCFFDFYHDKYNIVHNFSIQNFFIYQKLFIYLFIYVYTSQTYWNQWKSFSHRFIVLFINRFQQIIQMKRVPHWLPHLMPSFISNVYDICLKRFENPKYIFRSFNNPFPSLSLSFFFFLSLIL